MDLDSGRISQKLKTRQSLIDATRDLLAKNKPFTIDDVAKEALVSRATVYRYFSNLDTLILEAGVIPHSTTGNIDVFKEMKGAPVVERISHFQKLMHGYIQSNELPFRKFLAVIITQNSKGHTQTRGGWRLKYIEEALAPRRHEISPEAYDNLVIALATMIGIESFIVGKDVCKKEEKEIRNSMNWAVRQLVNSVFMEEE